MLKLHLKPLRKNPRVFGPIIYQTRSRRDAEYKRQQRTKARARARESP